MSALTFKGFLKRYLSDLSLTKTYSPFKLEKELNENLRLLEPLVLYIKLTMKSEQIDKFRDSRLIAALFEFEKIEDIEETLENKLLREPYQKVYNSYLVKKKRMDNELHTKTLLLKKIRTIQQQKQISNYRIYTDLKMNQGNVNDFLTNGNVSKLSLSSVEKIFDYVMFV